MFSFLNFSHHYRSQNIYPMCSTDPIHHQLHTIVSRYRNSIMTNFYISGQMDTQYLYSEFCTKYDNLLKHFTTIHMYVKWCVKNADIYLLHTSRRFPPWPNFFDLVKIKCKCWLSTSCLWISRVSPTYFINMRWIMVLFSIYLNLCIFKFMSKYL